MDYTQRRIGNGETAYVFGVLDIFNSGIGSVAKNLFY
jgi:hypothetical protein